MDKENILQITLKLYRLTLLFPKKEPIRYKARECGINVLTNALNLNIFRSSRLAKFSNIKEEDILFNVEKDLEILDSYLEIAKWQNWTSYFDVLNIKEEYDKLRIKIKEESRKIEKARISERQLMPIAQLITKRELKSIESQSVETTVENPKLNLREEKILKVLEEKGRVQVWEISEILPKVSKRTLRRDFVDLLKNGLIERIGERNNTFYQLKNQ